MLVKCNNSSMQNVLNSVASPTYMHTLSPDLPNVCANMHRLHTHTEWLASTHPSTVTLISYARLTVMQLQGGGAVWLHKPGFHGTVAGFWLPNCLQYCQLRRWCNSEPVFSSIPVNVDTEKAVQQLRSCWTMSRLAQCVDYVSAGRDVFVYIPFGTEEPQCYCQLLAAKNFRCFWEKWINVVSVSSMLDWWTKPYQRGIWVLRMSEMLSWKAQK